VRTERNPSCEPENNSHHGHTLPDNHRKNTI
jgi:hypothetical protein